MLHYEDIVVGSKARYGRYEVTREEVIEFASECSKDAPPCSIRMMSR